MKLYAVLLSVALAACGGGAAVLHAVPSKALANWNVSYGQVDEIMKTCYPDVDSVVFTDVYDGERAHLWVGADIYPTAAERRARIEAGLLPFFGGFDAGDPLTIYNNLPNCPQSPSGEVPAS